MAVELLEEGGRHRGEVAHGAVGVGLGDIADAGDDGRDRGMGEDELERGLGEGEAGAGQVLADPLGAADGAGEAVAGGPM